MGIGIIFFKIKCVSSGTEAKHKELHVWKMFRVLLFPIIRFYGLVYGWALDKFLLFGVTWLLAPESRNHYSSLDTFSDDKAFIGVGMAIEK